MQENVSGPAKTIKHTVSNGGKGGKYAIINDLSNIYASVKGVLAIASGGIISPTPLVSASFSTSHYERTDTTYAISEALFDELQVESDYIEGALDIKVEGEADINAKNMSLYKPEDKTHEEMSSTGFSVSDKGFSANHYQEKNGRGFGFGISGSWDRKGPFGDVYDFKCKDGENEAYISWANPNFEELRKSDLSLKTLPSRCIENVNQILRSVFETVGLEYQPIIFDTIKEESKDEPAQDDLSTLEQDLNAFDQLADDMADALPDDTSESPTDKDRLTSALILIKANELGYSATDMQNDQALKKAADLAEIDVSIAEWQKVSDGNTGVRKVFADNMVASLNGVRSDIANGHKSFESYWNETKHNLKSGQTSLGGAIPDGVGNLVSYVEDKVGNVISNNLPKVKASIYATLGTGFAYAIESARKLFGDENVAAAVNKIKDCKECIDEHSTPGQRKVAEYILGFATGAIMNKAYGAIKGKGKVPHIPDGFIGKSKSQIFTSTEKIAEILTPLHKKGQKFFDAGICAIEEAILNKTKFDALPSAVKKNFAKLIQVDKNGIVEGIAHMQGHHILPKAGTKTKALFEKALMSIHDKNNLIHLPDGVAKGLYPTRRCIHSGKHDGKYTKFFEKKAQEFLDQGRLENWSPEQYKNKIMELIVPTREALEKGTKPLNNAKTLLEKVKK